MKYLGIDFGLRRIGLAQSQGNIASPLKTMAVESFKDAVEKVKMSKGFDKIVVGLPEGKTGNTVLKFVKALERAGLDVETTDETLSTQQALAQMIELNIPKTKRQTNDAYSAAIILQNYLDSSR